MRFAAEDRITGSVAGRRAGVLRPGSRGAYVIWHTGQLAWNVAPAGGCCATRWCCATLGSAGTPDRGDGKGCGARCEGAGERWCGWRERGHERQRLRARRHGDRVMLRLSDSESALEKSARTLGGDVTFLGGPVNNLGGLEE